MKKQFNGVIYITTNIITGRKYIGKDIKNSPYYLGSGVALKEAIKKYGKKNFIKEILANAKDREDLADLEKYYISYYGANKSDLFYNIAEGGEGKKYEANPLSKTCIKQYDLEGNFIKEWSSVSLAAEELNLKRASVSACLSSGKSYKGFLFRKCDYKGDIFKKRKGGVRKQVIQYDKTSGSILNKFESVDEAVRNTGVSKTTIYNYVSGKTTDSRFKWGILNTCSKYNPRKIKKIEKIKVYQYDLDGKIINTYTCREDVPEIFNKGNVLSCLKEERKCCGGFMWSYKNNVTKYKINYPKNRKSRKYENTSSIN